MIKQIIVLIVSLIAGFSAAAENNIINIEKRGSGQPMILIHGMACSPGVWDEVAAYYSNSYEIHLVGISGFGNDNPIDAPHVLQAIRDALIDYVREENLSKPVLMGHSMGGFISLWASSIEPELFGKIISVDGLPYFPALIMPDMTPETAQPMVAQMQNAMNNQSPQSARENQKMMIASMISNESKQDAVVEMGMRSNAKVIGQAMGEMYTTDIRQEVKNITQPVLALGAWYAYRNYGTTYQSALAGYEAQFKVVPGAKVAMADKAYHFIFYDEPQWFFQQVDEFLKE